MSDANHVHLKDDQAALCNQCHLPPVLRTEVPEGLSLLTPWVKFSHQMMDFDGVFFRHDDDNRRLS